MRQYPRSSNPSSAWLLAGSTLLTLVIGVAGYLHAPSGTPVAIHFSLGGTPNGWASPIRAFFTAPLICLVLLFLQLLIPTIKPSADHLEKRIAAFVFGVAGIVLVVAQIYIYRHAV